MSQSCDFGFLTLPQTTDELDFVEIGTYPVIAFLRDGHPWSRMGSISIEQLDGQPIVIGTRSTQTRRTFDREVARYGVKVSSIQEVDDFEVVLTMAKAGRGIGIVGGTGTMDIREAEALRFREPSMSQVLHFAVATSSKRSRIADCLFRLANELLPTASSRALGGPSHG